MGCHAVLPADEESPVPESKKPAQRTTPSAASEGFTDEEKAAMRERALEQKAEKARGAKADGEADVLAKIAQMADGDRIMAERVHAIVKAAVPELTARTWYGMPAYAKDGRTICFFQDAGKFKARYATFGFQPDAALDDGPMWATSFALVELTPEVEARIAELVRRAAR
jgi:uncharacterized protein YdhG (YjbR/CyaY superfamily)